MIFINDMTIGRYNIVTPHYNLTFSLSFFFNDTATTEIYTLSLHDALPILLRHLVIGDAARRQDGADAYLLLVAVGRPALGDRKSTRLNSSHANISYAVFCLKKNKYLKTTRLYSSHVTISYAVFYLQK